MAAAGAALLRAAVAACQRAFFANPPRAAPLKGRVDIGARLAAPGSLGLSCALGATPATATLRPRSAAVSAGPPAGTQAQVELFNVRGQHCY